MTEEHESHTLPEATPQEIADRCQDFIKTADPEDVYSMLLYEKDGPVLEAFFNEGRAATDRALRLLKYGLESKDPEVGSVATLLFCHLYPQRAEETEPLFFKALGDERESVRRSALDNFEFLEEDTPHQVGVAKFAVLVRKVREAQAKNV